MLQIFNIGIDYWLLEHSCYRCSILAMFRYLPQVLQIVFCSCLTFGEQ